MVLAVLACWRCAAARVMARPANTKHTSPALHHQSLGLSPAIGCRSTCTGDDLDIILETNNKEAAHQIPANIT